MSTMDDFLFGQERVREDDRLIVDVEQFHNDERGVGVLDASRVEAYENIPVESGITGERVGSIAETDDGGIGLFEQRQTGLGDQMAEIRGATVTDRRDLQPVDFGRDRSSGRFTPEQTIAEPSSPSDRNPDDGQFTTPDPRPVTDIGRQNDDGLFDLF